MAYLKRVLKPRRQIKFVYITNTYKALLRDKSNSLTEDDLRRINEAFKQQKNKLPIYSYLTNSI